MNASSVENGCGKGSVCITGLKAADVSDALAMVDPELLVGGASVEGVAVVSMCRDDGVSILAEEVVRGDIVLVPHEGGGRRPLHVASVRREQIVEGNPMVLLTLENTPPGVRPVVVQARVGSRVVRLRHG